MEMSEKYWKSLYVFSDSSNDYVFGFPEWQFDGMHSHDFYELNIVLSGNAIHQLNAKRTRVRIGDVFAIPPGVHHGYMSSLNLRVFHILIHRVFMDRYAEELEKFSGFFMLFSIEPLLKEMREEQMHFTLREDELVTLKPYLDALARLWKKTDEQHCVMRNSLGLYIIALLCQWYQERDYTQISGLNQMRKGFVEGIQTLLTDYNQKLTIEDMAQRLHMSRSSYIQNFKALFGIAPGEFLTQYRLLKVKNYLAFTNMRLTDIAQETGFYDSSHLIREFKKREGLTPREYRKRTAATIGPEQT